VDYSLPREIVRIIALWITSAIGLGDDKNSLTGGRGSSFFYCSRYDYVIILAPPPALTTDCLRSRGTCEGLRAMPVLFRA
jgi:hypothetical protein